MATASFATDVIRVVKKVYYEGTSTLYEGMPVCYNFNTTTNIAGIDPGNSSYNIDAPRESATAAASTTTTEGYQSEGKFLRVENPSSDNTLYFAGVVVGTTC